MYLFATDCGFHSQIRLHPKVPRWDGRVAMCLAVVVSPRTNRAVGINPFDSWSDWRVPPQRKLRTPPTAVLASSTVARPLKPIAEWEVRLPGRGKRTKRAFCGTAKTSRWGTTFPPPSVSAP